MFHHGLWLQALSMGFPMAISTWNLSDPRRNLVSCVQADSLPLTTGKLSGHMPWATKCWPKTNRVPDNQQDEVDWDQQKLQAEIKTMVGSIQVPCTAKEGFLEERKMGELTLSKEPRTFHWLSLLEKERPFYLLGFAIVAEMRALHSLRLY